MKYNVRYRNLISLAPTEIDPTPSTIQGAHALIERYWALKVKYNQSPTGGRGVPTGRVMMIISPPPTICSIPQENILSPTPRISSIPQDDRLSSPPD